MEPKPKEWGLDTVMLLERTDDGGADIAFDLRFTKARERTPENRNDFEPVRITLAGDRWASTGTEPRPAGKPKEPSPLGRENANGAAWSTRKVPATVVDGPAPAPSRARQANLRSPRR